MNKGQFAGLLFTTFTKWQKHDATLRAAALTFFTIMPLPSIALIAVELLALFYGQQQALQHFISQISAVTGPAVANLLYELLSNAKSPLTSFFDSLIAVGFAFLGAIGALSVLQKSMDIIWEEKPKERGRAAFIKEKVLPFALIIVIGIIVIAVNALSTVLFNSIVFALQPVLGSFGPFLLKFLQIILSFSLGTLLFAIIFKMLPETTVEWQDVWLAALLTSLVFTILNYFFGLYLSLVKVSTLEGTAGSLIVLFLWIYLTSLFILFGAQFSKVYTKHTAHTKTRNQNSNGLPDRRLIK
jgi:membrane protein